VLVTQQSRPALYCTVAPMWAIKLPIRNSNRRLEYEKKFILDRFTAFLLDLIVLECYTSYCKNPSPIQ
jgi:hypothetical protein